MQAADHAGCQQAGMWPLTACCGVTSWCSNPHVPHHLHHKTYFHNMHIVALLPGAGWHGPCSLRAGSI